MAHRVCPWWLGYWLVSPLRRLFEKPDVILAPIVTEGMTVLEPGSGMGFFTLELARRVGPRGRVIAVDLQPRMIEGLKRRARKAGLLDRIDARLSTPESLGIAGLADIDFALVFAVVHELPAPDRFFAEMARALRTGGTLLFAEPRGHVTATVFDEELLIAVRAGLVEVRRPPIRGFHSALLAKP